MTQNFSNLESNSKTLEFKTKSLQPLWEGFWVIKIFGTKIANISYKFEMRLITFTITNWILNVCVIVLIIYRGIVEIGVLNVNLAHVSQYK